MKKNRYISMFTKFLLAFVLLGLIPLMLIGQFLYMRLSSGVEAVMVGNASQMAANMGKNTEDVIQKYDAISKYLYEYTSEDYTYFYELLKDTGISAKERERLIKGVLYNMLSMNTSVENIRFIYDRIYNVSRDSTKNIDTCKVLDAQWKPEPEELTGLYIMQTHSESNYYYHSDRKVFTLARNYMDVSDMKKAGTKRLGTLYIDIDPRELEVLEEGMDLGENGRISVIDSTDGTCIYDQDPEKIAKKDPELSKLLDLMQEDSGVCRTGAYIYAYSNVESAKWKVVARLGRQDIRETYLDSSLFLTGMLSAGILILGIFYGFSSYASRPVRELKAAMLRIQSGELDTRVEIKSHDEIRELGQGFNEMACSLQSYIDKVYVAELRQREAQLEALKSTIRPHYLYNTLEVIRMTALEENAEKASALIDSLSRQLRYLIGNESDQVTLEEELRNIREYFFIVRTRFDNRYELEIDVPPTCLRLKIVKLILQPIVENAVKHGLRPKKGEGKVRIAASRDDKILRIIVMDDGVGMTEEQTAGIRELLRPGSGEVSEEETAKASGGSPELSGGAAVPERSGHTGIGIKNTYDRIVKNYGQEYGFQVTSCEGLGTIFEYSLPILEDGAC